MGKSTQRKQEAAAAKIAGVAARLAATKDSGKDRRGVITASIMPHFVLDELQKVGGRMIREPELWTYRGKSKDSKKQLTELFRHCFVEFPVPRFLETQIVPKFIEGEDGPHVPLYGLVDVCRGVKVGWAEHFKWYIILAQGRSLHKEVFKDFMTKKESHLFTQAPDSLTVGEALWWAKGKALTNNDGVAYRIATSVFCERADIKDKWWQDVFRFFCVHDVRKDEITELLDFCRAARAENNEWTINKRSLEGLRSLSDKWHRDMARMKKIGGGMWDGMQLPTFECTTGKDELQRHWKVYEITRGDALAKEGNQMRHCVAGYKTHCMSGRTSIFTMKSVDAYGGTKHHLTIEVSRRQNEIVQARGLANRRYRADEWQMLVKWATSNGLTVSSRV